jgi:hypothetical protein
MNAQAAIAVHRDTTALDIVDPSGAALPASMALTPMQMAYQLAARGTDVATIREMLAIGRDMQADQARQAFDAAFASAKAEIKPIVKNRDGHNAKYADLSAYADAIDEILGKHGLAWRHTTPSQTEKTITVVCILSHSEQTPLTAGFDTSGNKNAIQSMGSTITYLQRYTLGMALGLATTAVDNDGQGAPISAEPLTEKQVMDLNDLLEETAAGRPNHKKAFLDYMKVERLDQIPGRDYQRSIAAINSTRVKP